MFRTDEWQVAGHGVSMTATGEPKSGTTWLGRLIPQLALELCGSSTNPWWVCFVCATVFVCKYLFNLALYFDVVRLHGFVAAYCARFIFFGRLGCRAYNADDRDVVLR